MKVIKISCVFLFFFIQTSFSNSVVSFDKEKIWELANDYITLLQKTVLQNSNDYYFEVGDYFKKPNSNEHYDDLKLSNTDLNVQDYFLKASKQKNVKDLSASIETIEISDCTLYSEIEGKLFAFVVVPKELVFHSSNKKIKEFHILKINVSSTPYKIEDVYNRTAEIEARYLTPCLKTQLDANKKLELAAQIETYYIKATALYKKKNYSEAIVLFDKILAINPDYSKAIDGKKAANANLTTGQLREEIETALEDKNPSIALQKLELMVTQNLATQEYLSRTKNSISQLEDQLLLDNLYNKAEYLFEKELYQKALPLYEELLSKRFKEANLIQRISVCKNSDPELIKNRITYAFDAAQASKKNREATFKTYYKYENSGYLKADNYHFMCLMMIGKGNKSLLRDMGITGNQSKNLAIKYFYKARNLGYNNGDVEILVFTKNFNKNKN